MIKLQVKLHDGTSFIMEVEDFNAVDMADLISEDRRQMIAIGNAVVQRQGILSILPTDEVDNE